MIISGKNLKRLIEKGINSVPKIAIAKAISDYIIKNKNRIIKIDVNQPQYKMTQFNSDGSSLRVPITDETYVITFKADKRI